MFAKLNALKNKKGFTLVELIVVLLILAILAALLIPALTGYIDKARGKTAVAEARAAVMAAQTLVDEAYAKDATATIEIGAGKTITIDAIQALAEVKATSMTGTVKNGQITEFEYVGQGKTVKYWGNVSGAGKFTVS